MDVYILLYCIEDGGLYLLEVLVVGIEVGQVVALYDTGLLVAHLLICRYRSFTLIRLSWM